MWSRAYARPNRSIHGPGDARLYRQLQELRAKLENHYHEVQDFEFTIERTRCIACRPATAR